MKRWFSSFIGMILVCAITIAVSLQQENRILKSLKIL